MWSVELLLIVEGVPVMYIALIKVFRWDSEFLDYLLIISWAKSRQERPYLKKLVGLEKIG